MTQRQFFKRSLTGLNSEFSLSYNNYPPQAEKPSLPYYLPIARGRINWIQTFPKGISAMWNTISLIQDLNSCPVSISYDDNHYTTGIVISYMGSNAYAIVSCRTNLSRKSNHPITELLKRINLETNSWTKFKHKLKNLNSLEIHHIEAKKKCNEKF